MRSPHLRQLLGRFATYVGASPYPAPATLSVIAHVELTGGVWYPQGGIYPSPTPCSAWPSNWACGSTAAPPWPGSKRAAAESSAAPGRRSAASLPARAGQRGRDHRLRTAARSLHSPRDGCTSCSAPRPPAPAMCCCWASKASTRSWRTTTSFSTHDYRGEFADIFAGASRRRTQPSTWPSPPRAIRPTRRRAAKTGLCWSMRRPRPPLRLGDSRRRPTATVVFDTLARFGLDVRARMRSEAMLTPTDIHRLTGAWRGALYGISSNQALNAFRRPHNRCPDVRPLLCRRHDPPWRRRTDGHPVGQSSSRHDPGRTSRG